MPYVSNTALGKPLVWDKHYEDSFLHPNFPIFFSIPYIIFTYRWLMPSITCNSLYVMLHWIFFKHILGGDQLIHIYLISHWHMHSLSYYLALNKNWKQQLFTALISSKNRFPAISVTLLKLRSWWLVPESHLAQEPFVTTTNSFFFVYLASLKRKNSCYKGRAT